MFVFEVVPVVWNVEWFIVHSSFGCFCFNWYLLIPKSEKCRMSLFSSDCLCFPLKSKEILAGARISKFLAWIDLFLQLMADMFLVFLILLMYYLILGQDFASSKYFWENSVMLPYFPCALLSSFVRAKHSMWCIVRTTCFLVSFMIVLTVFFLLSIVLISL